MRLLHVWLLLRRHFVNVRLRKKVVMSVMEKIGNLQTNVYNLKFGVLCLIKIYLQGVCNWIWINLVLVEIGLITSVVLIGLVLVLMPLVLHPRSCEVGFFLLPVVEVLHVIIISTPVYLIGRDININKRKVKKMKRKRISYNGAKRLFTATAQKTKKENVMSAPMRGGIRM